MGWGVHMGDSHILGTWTFLDRQLHISFLELKVVIAALHHWVSVLQAHQVLVATDNTTVVSYINKRGTHSLTLLRLVVDPFMWLQTQDTVLRARHSRLFECDSGLPIQTQSADIDRVESPFRNCKFF